MGNKLNPTFIPTDGLVAYYKLDGDATDSSGNGNNGTANNVTFTNADRGYVEEVGVFNGSSGYVATSYDLSGVNTISLWCYEEGATGVFHHFYDNNTSSSNRSICFFRRSTSTFEVYAGSTTRIIQDGTILNYIPQNKWVNLTIVANSGDNKVYVDGVLRSTSTTTFSGTSNDLTFGKRFSNSEYFDGKLGDIFIYNRELSQQEITTLYQEGLKQLGPTNLLNRSQGFPKYSLSNLEQGKVLEISKPVNGGVYYDQTGNGNNSVSVVSVTDSTVGLNNVMSFNGVDSWIQTNDLISGKSALTIAATVKFNSISGIEPITANWASGTNQHLVRNNAGQLQFYLQTNINQYQLTAGSLSAGKYYRIINTYDGSIMRSYINGVEVGSLAASGTITNGTALDGWARYNTTYLDGDMSNLEIIDRAFSVSEVLQDYYSNKII